MPWGGISIRCLEQKHVAICCRLHKKLWLWGKSGMQYIANIKPKKSPYICNIPLLSSPQLWNVLDVPILWCVERHCGPSSQADSGFLKQSSLKTRNAGLSGFQPECAFTLWYPWQSLSYCLKEPSWWQWSLNEANNGSLLCPQSPACLKIDSLVD